MKLIVSMSLALACALAAALGGNAAPQGQTYKAEAITFRTALIHVEAIDPGVTVKPHARRVTRPRLARVPVRATRSVRRVYYPAITGASHYGRASWYTGNFGACGHALTGYYAASRTLPCGSHVLVSYGGRSVVVTIMDRGPQSTLRDLDLSRSAFEALAPVSKGIIWVHWKLQ
jgi:rare lipoprotein A (peptidoglycan hydrolase)